MVATLPPPHTTEPPPDGEVPVCLMCGQPAGWTSPTGHHFCAECRDSWDRLRLDELYPTDPAYPHEPVNLDELLSGDPPAEDWYIEPLLPRGKLVGITSSAGHGKSLLLLDIACKKATGQEILEQPAGEPEHVVYLDMEMGPDELYDRLSDLGYNRDHPQWKTLLQHLHYYQLIALPALNTEPGGQALEEIIDRHHATFLVIDTLARVITGNENDAEPYQELFRHTETMLKRRAITLARLDHLGKDTSKGSRGSSAKVDGLDVMWQMEQVVQGTMIFKRTKGRQVWVAEHATIHRVEDNGIVTHTTNTEPVSQKIVDLATLLTHLDIPIETGVPTVQKLLKEAGQGRRRADVRLAIRLRRGWSHLRTTPPDHPPGPPGPPPPKTLIDIDNQVVPKVVPPPDHLGGVFPSLMMGPPPASIPDPAEFDLDDIDYDDLPDTYEEA